MDPIFGFSDALLPDYGQIHVPEVIDSVLMQSDQSCLLVPSPKFNDAALPDHHETNSPTAFQKEMESLLADDEIHPIVASPKVIDAPSRQRCISFGPPATPQTNPSDHLSVQRCITEFVRSSKISLTIHPNLVVFPITVKCFRALNREFNKKEFLSSKEVDSFRYEYCPKNRSLTIFLSPSPPHDTMPCVASDILELMHQAGFLSDREHSAVVVNIGSAVEMPANSFNGMHNITVLTPDAGYSLSEELFAPVLTCFPRVVFEVGFSQSYESLQEGAHEWLLRGQGSVKLVVMIKLEEKPIEMPKKKHRKCTANEPNNKYRHEQGPGNPNSIAVHDKQHDANWAAIGSTISPLVSKSYDSFVDVFDVDWEACIVFPGGDGSWMKNDDQQVDTEQVPTAYTSPANAAPPTAPTGPQTEWYHAELAPRDPALAPFVGRITGFIELYRYDGITGLVYQDGARYDIFPVGSAQYNDPVPRIYVSDVIPISYIEGDTGRSFEFPIDIYRAHFEEAVNELWMKRHERQVAVSGKRRRDYEENCIKAAATKAAMMKKAMETTAMKNITPTPSSTTTRKKTTPTSGGTQRPNTRSSGLPIVGPTLGSTRRPNTRSSGISMVGPTLGGTRRPSARSSGLSIVDPTPGSTRLRSARRSAVSRVDAKNTLA